MNKYPLTLIWLMILVGYLVLDILAIKTLATLVCVPAVACVFFLEQQKNK